MKYTNIFLAVFAIAFIILTGSTRKLLQTDITEWSSIRIPETELKNNMRIDTRTNTPVAMFGINYGPLAGTPEEMARQFLLAHHELFRMKPDLSDLRHIITQESPAGYHVRFQQTYQGLPVYFSDMVVSISSPTNKVTMYMGNYFPDAALPSVHPTLSEEAAIQKAKLILNAKGGLTGDPFAKLMVVSDSAVYRLAYRIILPLSDPDGEWQVFVEALTGEVLAVKNMGFRYNGQGYVFKPDPLTNGQVYYGSPGFVDNMDADTPQLTAQRVIVTLPDITFSGGVYKLEGPYVRLVDWDPRTIAPVTSTTENFYYTRSQDGFEDVMVYYYVDQSQRYLQSLGFSDIQNGPITVDPHGFQLPSGEFVDNAEYQPTFNRIRLGEGNVDNAEDADMIIHEYGHAIQEAQVPGFGVTLEASAMGEGFGDYWPGSYSASISSFQQAQVFMWDAGIKSDGTGAFWSGRRLDSPKTYANYDPNQTPHQNGVIWSGTLWDIWQALGRNVTDKLIIQHHYYLSPSATMPDAAQALLQVDRDLFGGSHLSQINQKLYNRGFRPVLYVPSVFPSIASALSTALSGQTVVADYEIHTVNSNLIVASGITLQINPGAELIFDPGFSLTINGKLVAVSDDPNLRIIFSGLSLTPGSWGGIRINSGSSTSTQKNSTLRRCDIKYATTGITITYAANQISHNVTLDKCRISDCSSDGIYAYGASVALGHPTIRDNHIHDNAGTGLFLQNYAKPLVYGNRIERNSDGGIYGTGGISNNDVTFNYIGNNYFTGVQFGANSMVKFHRNTVSGNQGNGISLTSSSNATASGADSDTSRGRNYVFGNLGDGLSSSNSSPNFGTDPYGNNRIENNGQYQAKQVGSGQLKAEHCYWAGQQTDISGNVDNVPYLTTTPSPIGWGRSGGYNPSYLMPSDPHSIAEAGYQNAPGLSKGGNNIDNMMVSDFDLEAWMEKFKTAMQAGLEKGEWDEAAELITALWRELQDGRVPKVEYKLLADYAEQQKVALSIRKYLALTLVEKRLAEHDVSTALADLTTYRQRHAEHNVELLVQAGIIHLHFQNDLPATEKILEQLHALVAPNDEAARAEKQLLSTTITKYRHYFGGASTPKPADNFRANSTEIETIQQVANYPNPFNPETTIRFHLNEQQKVRLVIFDLTGKLVRTLVEGELPAGEQTISWDGRDRQGGLVANGIYFYELVVGNKIKRSKMTLVR